VKPGRYQKKILKKSKFDLYTREKSLVAGFTYFGLLIDPYSGKACSFKLYSTLYVQKRARPWALPESGLGFAPPHTCPYSGLGTVPYTDNFITRIWENIGFLVRREIL